MIIKSNNNIKYNLYRLLQSIDNRLCADCDDTVINEKDNDAYASITYGVWLCKRCALIHSKILRKINSNIKSILSDDWTSNDLIILATAKSNVHANKTYEKYYNPSILYKINQSSNDYEVEIWIKAKYQAQLFEFPPKTWPIGGPSRMSTDNNADRTTSENKNQDILPTRLTDFFLIIGCGDRIESNNKNNSNSDNNIASIYFNPTIISCYPQANHYNDMDIPEMIATLVAPNGLNLKSQSQPPQCFSVVLTDINRVKVYAVVLSIYELVTPERLEQFRIDNSNISTTYYEPKSLVLLSHYPFFHLMSSVLKQFFRISLSASPIPLERYIVNFISDTPLPPRGLVEVNGAIADMAFQIRRPAPNQLPMVDFSYRPLFLCLSVNTIIIIFRCLLVEHSVCIYSHQIALLTPIQEALLSFLFPLLWQGVYIPVLGRDLLDIIDAPVPFLVGTLTDLIADRLQIQDSDSSTALFVDADNDRLYMNNIEIDVSNENYVINSIPTLPKQFLSKLKPKLIEFGGCIYQSNKTMSREVLRGLNDAFINNNYLKPINTDDLIDSGVSKRRFSTITINNTQPIITASRSSIGKKNDKLSYSNNRSTSISTLISYKYNDVSMTSTDLFNNKPTKHKLKSTYLTSLLFDPINNVNYNDNFNANELRIAFLRFFIVSLMDQKDIINENITFNNTISSRKSTYDNSSSEFNEGYLKEDELFLRSLLQTQMYMNYKDERINNPKLPDILLFNECIIEKRNRSVFSKKLPTPFLDSTSYEITENYTCPSPSTWGIETNKEYVYMQFPLINYNNISNILSNKKNVLINEIELKRIENNNYYNINQLLYSKYNGRNKYQSNHATNQTSNTVDSYTNVNEWLDNCIALNTIITSKINIYKYKYRYYRFKCKLIKYKDSTIIIQNNIRIYLCIKKLNKLKSIRSLQQYIKQVINIQSAIRKFLTRKRFKYLCNQIIKIQSYYRRFRSIHQFIKIKKSCIIISKYYRKYYYAKKFRNHTSSYLNLLRSQLVILWLVDHSSLIHRTSYYDTIKSNCCINIKLSLMELKRLYIKLDLENNTITTNKSTNINDNITNYIAKLKQIHSFNDINIFNQKKDLTSLNSYGLSNKCKPYVTNNINNEVKERSYIYSTLKSNVLSTRSNSINNKKNNDYYFSLFNILNNKKRKQSLSNIVWTQSSESNIQSSIECINFISELKSYELNNIYSYLYQHNHLSDCVVTSLSEYNKNLIIFDSQKEITKTYVRNITVSK